MNLQSLQEAIAEAERFLQKADEAEKQIVADWKRDNEIAKQEGIKPMNPLTYSGGGREVAACKRASMDLSRALTNLRR